MIKKIKTIIVLIITSTYICTSFLHSADLSKPEISITKTSIIITIKLNDAFDIYKDFNTKYREIEKGKKVSLIYSIKLYKRTWFLFFPTEEEVKININSSNSLNRVIITKELQYTYALKFFEIITKDNLYNEETKEIIYYKEPLKETLQKIKKLFFEKKFDFKIPLSKLSLSNKYKYFFKVKVEFIAVDDNSPFNTSIINFETNWKNSQLFRIQ